MERISKTRFFARVPFRLVQNGTVDEDQVTGFASLKDVFAIGVCGFLSLGTSGRGCLRDRFEARPSSG